MRRPFRLFLVPWWAVAWAWLLCLLFANFDRIFFWVLNASIFDGKLPYSHDAQFDAAKLRVVGGVYAIYGALRALMYTPWLPTKFSQWLLMSPWSSSKPLPIESGHLAWQDAFIALFCMPIMFSIGMNPIAYAIVYAAVITGSYLLCTAVMLRVHGFVAPSYAIIIGLTLIPLLAQLLQWDPTPEIPALAALAVFAILYVVAAVARTRAFAAVVANSIKTPEFKLDASAWWPSPVPDLGALGFRDAFLLSVYVGGFVYYVNVMDTDYANNPERLSTEFKRFFWMITAACALFRLLLYCGNRWPPISVLGRLATGRLIIPGYDKVLVAPICAVILPWICFEVMTYYQVSPYASTAIAAALLVLITLGVGPSYRSWQLTGQHRMVNLQPKTLRGQARRQRMGP